MPSQKPLVNVRQNAFLAFAGSQMCARIMFARAFVLIRETTSINVRPNGCSALSGREMCASVMFAGACRAARVDPPSKALTKRSPRQHLRRPRPSGATKRYTHNDFSSKSNPRRAALRWYHAGRGHKVSVHFPRALEQNGILARAQQILHLRQQTFIMPGRATLAKETLRLPVGVALTHKQSMHN